MIGIIGAMELETDSIVKELKNAKRQEISGILFTQGAWCGVQVVVAVCGVGKVFAALCTEAMILHYRPEFIVNTGVAGALDPGLEILDVVIGRDVVQHDMDTSPLGDPPGLISGINRVALPADGKVCARFEKAAAECGVRAVAGRIASGDQFIASAEKRGSIRSLFGASCCEMEGAAIGQVCHVNQVPFAILRTISDHASGEAGIDYPEFVARAAAQSVRILKKGLEEQ